MKRPILAAILAAILVSSACDQHLPTVIPVPSPTGTAAPIRTAIVPSVTPAATVQTATIVRPVVRVHAEADVNSAVVAWLTEGEQVAVVSWSGDWCKIAQGYVFRGCLSGNTDLKCEADK